MAIFSELPEDILLLLIDTLDDEDVFHFARISRLHWDLSSTCLTRLRKLGASYSRIHIQPPSYEARRVAVPSTLTFTHPLDLIHDISRKPMVARFIQSVRYYPTRDDNWPRRPRMSIVRIASALRSDRLELLKSHNDPDMPSFLRHGADHAESLDQEPGDAGPDTMFLILLLRFIRLQELEFGPLTYNFEEIFRLMVQYYSQENLDAARILPRLNTLTLSAGDWEVPTSTRSLSLLAGCGASVLRSTTLTGNCSSYFARTPMPKVETLEIAQGGLDPGSLTILLKPFQNLRSFKYRRPRQPLGYLGGDRPDYSFIQAISDAVKCTLQDLSLTGFYEHGYPGSTCRVASMKQFKKLRSLELHVLSLTEGILDSSEDSAEDSDEDLAKESAHEKNLPSDPSASLSADGRHPLLPLCQSMPSSLHTLRLRFGSEHNVSPRAANAVVLIQDFISNKNRDLPDFSLFEYTYPGDLALRQRLEHITSILEAAGVQTKDSIDPQFIWSEGRYDSWATA